MHSGVRIYQRQTDHGPGSHREAVTAVASVVAFTDVVDQELAGHVYGSLAIVLPPALFCPKVALEGRRAAYVQGLLADHFLLVLRIGLKELSIEAESIDFERKRVLWHCILVGGDVEASLLN